MIRDRDSGDVPTSVTISLAAVDPNTGNGGPPLVTDTVHPNKIGVFATSIALSALPVGSYELELRAGDRLVATTGFQVDRILKPAYRLDVATGRRIYVAGDQIKVTAHATFYEGTPVPGVALRTAGFLDSSFTTDATGTATKKTVARIPSDEGEEPDGQPQILSIDVTPATAEEGEIAASSREIVVFPSHWTIAGTATIRDGRVRASGTLSEIARDRLERQVNAGADPWSLDAAGKAIAGHTVTLTFYDVTMIKRKSGTRYDFIEKKVVPVYEYDTSERVADTIRVKTDSKGRFSASIHAADGHAYRVRATATDTDGHVARWIVWANEPYQLEVVDQGPVLALTADPRQSAAEFGVGDRIDLKMSDPAAAGEGATDRYLFYTAQRGIRDVVVQDSARFRSTFGRSAAPDLRIDGVRFNGSRYSGTTTFAAAFRTSDRALTVHLSTDAARYAPGADVRVTVTTKDRSGDPVAATVILRAVDEKLFTLGGALAADPLGEIYAEVDSGIHVIYRSHRSPRPNNDGGGGDTGGGGRDDFRDSLLFESVETGSDGRATVTMHLSDDLTSWHVSASAIGAGLQAGEGEVLVPVGLPFFVEATIAPEYLVTDRPELGLRAFGTSLKATSKVTFAVDSDDLGMHVSGLAADAFETVRVPLPAAVARSARDHHHSADREWHERSRGSPDPDVHGRRVPSRADPDHLPGDRRRQPRPGRRRSDRGHRVGRRCRPLRAPPARPCGHELRATRERPGRGGREFAGQIPVRRHQRRRRDGLRRQRVPDAGRRTGGRAVREQRPRGIGPRGAHRTGPLRRESAHLIPAGDRVGREGDAGTSLIRPGRARGSRVGRPPRASGSGRRSGHHDP